MRQDLRRVAATLGGLDGGRLPARAEALCRYTAALLGQIGAHHEGESEILWPVVAAAAGPAVDLAPLADDRQAVDAVTGQASQALDRAGAAGSGAGELCASVAMLRDVLSEHIDDEEAQVFPAMLSYLTVDAYRWCESQIWQRVALHSRKFAVPWLARHARPDERARLLAAFGWQARMLQAAGGPGYARLERQAFDAETHERRSAMGQLQLSAEQTARATPETIWELTSDARQYPQRGPWSAGDTSAPATPPPTAQGQSSGCGPPAGTGCVT